MLVAQNSLGPVCPVPLTVRGKFDAPSPDNAKVLSLLADVAASHSAAKPTKGKQAKPAATTPTKKFKLDPFGCPDPVTEPPVYAKKHRL